MRRTFLLPLAILASASLAPAQTTWFVDASAAPGGDGSSTAPYAAIQDAISAGATLAGDTVLVAPGTYVEELNFAGKDVTVEAQDPSLPLPVIGVPGSGPAVRFEAGETRACTLRHVVIEDASAQGSPSVGGGVRIVGASPTLEGVTIRGCSAFRGGGAAVDGGAPLVLHCTFEGNNAFEGGGLYVPDGTVRLEGCTFLDHRDVVVGAGVAVAFSGGLEVEDCAFEDGLLSAGGRGGAIAMTGPAASATLTNSRFERNGGGFNAGVSGGAIAGNSQLTAVACTFDRNGLDEGASSGGACEGGTYTDCTFTLNSAQTGGALSSATAIRCIFTGNRACGESSGSGGAASGCTLERCVLRNNSACSSGGGARTSQLSACLVEDNFVINTCEGGLVGEGGGLYFSIAEHCVLRGNNVNPNNGCSDLGHGGGATRSTLAHCVVTGNRAPASGGVHSTTCDFVTIAANEATESAAAGQGSFSNSILWSNFGPTQLDPSSTVSYSITQGGLQPGTGNLSIDPLFLSPAAADVGLTAVSPAIDAADPAAPLDADGSRADMGARPFDPSANYFGGTYCEVAGIQAVLLDYPSLGAQAPARFVVSGLPPGQFALLVLGSRPDRQTIPTSATLCLGGTLVRLPVQMVAANGAISQDIDAASIAALGAGVGDFIHMQFWYRSGPAAASVSTAFEARVGL